MKDDWDFSDADIETLITDTLKRAHDVNKVNNTLWRQMLVTYAGSAVAAICVGVGSVYVQSPWPILPAVAVIAAVYTWFGVTCMNNIDYTREMATRVKELDKRNRKLDGRTREAFHPQGKPHLSVTPRKSSIVSS